MNRDWESDFRNWAKPSSDTEQQKYENVERMMREAIKQDKTLSQKNIDVFAQGRIEITQMCDKIAMLIYV